MIKYWQRSHNKLIKATLQHAQLSLTALVIGIILAVIVILIGQNKPNWNRRAIYLFSVLYSVPSMAMFALLIPFTGLGETTATIALVIYCQYILLRSFDTAIDEVDETVVESAVGMGMTNNQVFFKIQLPLAMPGIFSGIRQAATSTIGIANIASTINAGGLGTIIFDGLRTMNIIKIVWGALLSAMLCIIFNIVISLIEWVMTRDLR